MNRLPLLHKKPSRTSPPVIANEACSIPAACHMYFAPLHYEPNYPYPLVIWLHGPHDNENQLKKVMPLISMRNYVGAAPRATALSEEDDGSQICFVWREDDRNLQFAQERLWECIDGARQRFSICAQRVFLAGLECGGTMALRLALSNPDQFAGALSFGGPFPDDRAPLARLHAARRIPFFFATTAQSTHYPQAMVCQHLRLFHSAGMSVTLRQYPGADGLTTLMLSDMDRWIMEHITATPPYPAGDLLEQRSVN
jgi:phospholipase/carboxylesterase